LRLKRGRVVERKGEKTLLLSGSRSIEGKKKPNGGIDITEIIGRLVKKIRKGGKSFFTGGVPGLFRTGGKTSSGKKGLSLRESQTSS